MRYTFDLTFASKMQECKNAMNQVWLFLSQKCGHFNPSDLLDLKLIFNELLVNAVIHGNKLDQTKKVVIIIRIDPGMIYGKISDEGSGFANCTASTESLDIDSEHGRGIKIVSSLTDKITYLGCGNEVEFYKRVALNG